MPTKTTTLETRDEFREFFIDDACHRTSRRWKLDRWGGGDDPTWVLKETGLGHWSSNTVRLAGECVAVAESLADGWKRSERWSRTFIGQRAAMSILELAGFDMTDIRATVRARKRAQKKAEAEYRLHNIRRNLAHRLTEAATALEKAMAYAEDAGGDHAESLGAVVDSHTIEVLRELADAFGEGGAS